MKVEDRTRVFHHFWIYDLCIAMDKNLPINAEKVVFKIQYEEISIDVESPPIYTFFDELCTIEEALDWFDLILEEIKRK